MKLSQVFGILAVVLFPIGISAVGNCPNDEWILYNEVKCLKLDIQLPRSFEEADNFCKSMTAEVLTIKSEPEQQFITELVYDTSSFVGEVWLAASRIGDTNEFQWNDGSPLEYTNWQTGSPSSVIEKECVQMTSRLTKDKSNAVGDGFWTDIGCAAPKLVVCQAVPIIDESEILNAVLENKRQIQELKLLVAEMKSNPVPLGFIYVQLPRQPEPSELWTDLNWLEVTSDYAGRFFRAEGGNSNLFGEDQEADAPRLSQVQYLGSTVPQGLQDVEIKLGAWSDFVRVGSHPSNYTFYELLRFYSNDGEIRPKNTAIRIWKRIP